MITSTTTVITTHDVKSIFISYEPNESNPKNSQVTLNILSFVHLDLHFHCIGVYLVYTSIQEYSDTVKAKRQFEEQEC